MSQLCTALWKTANVSMRLARSHRSAATRMACLEMKLWYVSLALYDSTRLRRLYLALQLDVPHNVGSYELGFSALLTVIVSEHPHLWPLRHVVRGACAGARLRYGEFGHLTRIPMALMGCPALFLMILRGTAGPMRRVLPAALFPRRRNAYGRRLS